MDCLFGNQVFPIYASLEMEVMPVIKVQEGKCFSLVGKRTQKINVCEVLRDWGEFSEVKWSDTNSAVFKNSMVFLENNQAFC